MQSKNADYQGRLSHNEKIIHYYTDSKVFDFSKHADSVDLYFIDGDHSYQGVYSDTKNIFSNRKEQSIVVWHDFKLGQNEYRAEVIKAVYDALGKDFDNVYVYLLRRCHEANVSKDAAIMEEILTHLRSMRDNWKEVMKKAGT